MGTSSKEAGYFDGTYLFGTCELYKQCARSGGSLEGSACKETYCTSAEPIR